MTVESLEATSALVPNPYPVSRISYLVSQKPMTETDNRGPIPISTSPGDLRDLVFTEIPQSMGNIGYIVEAASCRFCEQPKPKRQDAASTINGTSVRPNSLRIARNLPRRQNVFFSLSLRKLKFPTLAPTDVTSGEQT